MRAVLVVLIVLSPVDVLAQPLGPNRRGLLTPYHPNIYGPGIIAMPVAGNSVRFLYLETVPQNPNRATKGRLLDRGVARRQKA